MNLYDEKSKWLYKITYNYLYDKTLLEDVLQEVWAAAYEQFGTIRYYDNINAWLIQVMKNQAQKLSKKREHLDFDIRPEHLDDRGLIEILPPDFPDNYRTVLELYYLKGYSTVDIAAQLHYSEGYVRAWLHRARICLKTKINQEGGSV